jgi:hypothetical protein
MYVFAPWKTVRGRGRQPALPRGLGFSVLADCGIKSQWALVSISRDRAPLGTIPVDHELDQLLFSAVRYPPALALARPAFERDARPHWSPKRLAATFADLLRLHLRAQHRSHFVLAEALVDELGYLTSGEFVWLLTLTRDHGKHDLVRWVSSDFQIYTNPARHFRISPAMRKLLYLA